MKYQALLTLLDLAATFSWEDQNSRLNSSPMQAETFTGDVLKHIQCPASALLAEASRKRRERNE